MRRDLATAAARQPDDMPGRADRAGLLRRDASRSTAGPAGTVDPGAPACRPRTRDRDGSKPWGAGQRLRRTGTRHDRPFIALAPAMPTLQRLS